MQLPKFLRNRSQTAATVQSSAPSTQSLQQASKMGKKNQHPSHWIVGLMAVGVLSIGSITYFIVEGARPKLNIEQLTVPVKLQTLKLRITASGTVVPVQSVNLSPKAAGRLAELYVEQGDRVQEGQKIAIMDNRDLQAQLSQTRASYEQAKARLEEAQRGSRPEDIAQAKARLEQAQARLAQARRGRPEEIDQVKAQVDDAQGQVSRTRERLRNYESLAQQGAVNRDQFIQVRTENTTAEANLKQAQKHLELLQKGSRPEEINQLKGAVAEAQSALELMQNGTRSEQIDQFKAAADAAQAQVQAAQVQLEDTIVRAPFSGIVTQKYASKGAFVTPTTSASSTNSATSTSIVAIAKDIEVKAKVPEVDIGQLKPGQPVEIVADSYPDQVFKGRVRLVSPEAVVEQNVTSFEARVGIETGREQLRSGMNVNVTFLGKELPNALTVPTVAIVTEEGKTGVLIVDEKNQPKFHPVKIGPSIEDQTQILAGIKQGDRVFIDLPKDSKFKSNESKNERVKTGTKTTGGQAKP